MRKIKIKDIYIVNNFFTSDEIIGLQDFINRSEFVFDENVQHDILDLHKMEDSPMAKETKFIQDFLEEKNLKLKSLIEKDFSCKLGNESSSTIVKCYQGWGINYHVDNWDNLPTDGGYPTRDISTIMYLSDRFSGGNLHFPDLDIEIEPVAGSVIYFPSTECYKHGVTRIESGVRITMTGFWHMLDKR